ncbi:NYN domain-containing protein [Alkalihalophilus marmarensis]|uniref:NYN domain-containing protein n=1 Tax=Alkalihalophilus marmarensis TaxID=521377 RepID=UPI002DBB6AAD|nr:NYN domain-containing protein [Alkalihalophilus marmarensis]MEC2074187.1 NYN domain-containing protein [Alkalihalophilus marmarensis]
MKAAILVDEQNAMSTMHLMDVKGLTRWKTFFDAIHHVVKRDYPTLQMDYCMYGAVVPKKVNHSLHEKRRRFFHSLSKDQIKVSLGYCLLNAQGVMTEKGVDVELALDIYQKALEGYELLIVFSGDSDLVPAIERAKALGTKVVAVLGDNQPATHMSKVCDATIPFTAIVHLLPKSSIVFFKETHLKGAVLT